MSKQQKLQVFARIKPTSYQSQNLSLAIHKHNTLVIQTNRSKLSSAKEQSQYNFTHIFEQQTSQQQIFQVLAKPVIDNCLEGFNGTIFAYGQTGSGKTYTMSGGQQWEQRGIIPRVLSYIFQQFQMLKTKIKYQTRVSYIQIYNENAYDLLDQNNTQNNFQQWPKITCFQDEENRFNIKNGSAKICKTEEEALNFLMMGNYLRKVSCTNLNQASSRSHCIFILNIRIFDIKSSTQFFSKINLVDLAGSQRVSKSHASGAVLTQAKSINLSLSFLEQVIIALNKKSKGKQKFHIPYRNSLLTTFLKDSLGGNCKTVMIATISSQLNNQDQTISTLRFSQRVKQIKNDVHKNETHSLQTKMQMLERQNLQLKKKIQKLGISQNKQYKRTDSQQIRDYYSKPSQKQINRKVLDFMSEKTQIIQVQNIQHVNYYFKKMKQIYSQKMREYANQLTYISQKIINYETMLDQREKNQNKYK